MTKFDKFMIIALTSAILFGLGYLGVSIYDCYNTYTSIENCIVTDKMSAHRTYEDNKTKEVEDVFFLTVKEENPNAGYNPAALGKGYVNKNGDKTFSLKITKEEFESLKIGDKVKVNFERGIIFDTIWNWNYR